MALCIQEMLIYATYHRDKSIRTPTRGLRVGWVIFPALHSHINAHTHTHTHTHTYILVIYVETPHWSVAASDIYIEW